MLTLCLVQVATFLQKVAKPFKKKVSSGVFLGSKLFSVEDFDCSVHLLSTSTYIILITDRLRKVTGGL